MNGKLILTASIAWLVVIVAGCSETAQQDTSSLEVGDEVQSVAGETSIEQIDPATESGESPISEVDTDGLTTVAEVKPERDEELESVTETASQTDQSVAPIVEIPQPDNELAEGEYRWSQLLARDAILPIYNPQFASANVAPYEDNELVIGLEINGEAKAYAIGPLNGREMVNDTIGGIPVLVTW